MKKDNYPLHIFLFLVTVLTTMIAGAELATGKLVFFTPSLGAGAWLDWDYLVKGIPFSASFLIFLTVHEFGHYFTAVYHKVKCSLPYYIPVFLPFSQFNIGSFGAVIRIREMPASRRKYFDIGVAGPLAGFVVSIGLLVYGFTHLPPLDSFVLSIHPEYIDDFGGLPPSEIVQAVPGQFLVGSTLLFDLLKNILPGDPSQVPPAFEMMHYPFIFVGYLTLFFTALNLLPIGQLDGGHVVYGLFGRRRAGIISRITVLCLLMIGGTGLMSFAPIEPAWSWHVNALFLLIKFDIYIRLVVLVVRRIDKEASGWDILIRVLAILIVQALIVLAFPGLRANLIWLLYAFMAATVIGVDHPAAADDTPLDTRRKVLGWLAILIFILCFTAEPLVIT